MKIVKKNVYYCDHCNKKGLSVMHIRHHEARCTNNPNRYCGVCDSLIVKYTVEAFKARFTLVDNPAITFPEEPIYDPSANQDAKLVTWIGEPVTLQQIRDAVDNCPACILAVLRQTGLNHHYFHLEKFDFKNELTEWLRVNGAANSPYGYC